MCVPHLSTWGQAPKSRFLGCNHDDSGTWDPASCWETRVGVLAASVGPTHALDTECLEKKPADGASVILLLQKYKIKK